MIDKILRELKKTIKENYLEIAIIDKEIAKLEKERNKIVKQKSDRVYENVVKDETLKRINLKIETLKDIKRG